MDALIRSLQQASGDVVVVATVDTFTPYGDIREYAVKMFENHGRGIGQKGKDNGLLVLLAVKDRQVWVEVGYDLEEFITDGFAGELSRKVMVPEFRSGDYGAGTARRRVAHRGQDRRAAERDAGRRSRRRDDATRTRSGSAAPAIVVLIVLFILLNIIGRTRRRRALLGRPVRGAAGTAASARSAAASADVAADSAAASAVLAGRRRRLWRIRRRPQRWRWRRRLVVTDVQAGVTL